MQQETGAMKERERGGMKEINGGIFSRTEDLSQVLSVLINQRTDMLAFRLLVPRIDN